jgi:hypothetical protein
MILRNKRIRFALDILSAGDGHASGLEELDAAHGRRRSRVRALATQLLIIGLLLGWVAANASAQAGTAPAQHDVSVERSAADNTLIVWAGDKAHVAPDFIAIIDFDERSPNYGKVLRTVAAYGPERGRQRTASRRAFGRWQDARARRTAECFAGPGSGFLFRCEPPAQSAIHSFG